MSATGAMVTEEKAVPVEEATERNRQSQSAPEEARGEKEECEKKEKVDPELFTCLLQPLTLDSDSDYVGIRMLLLHQKAAAGLDQRKDWRCNGKGYVGFRNFINKPLNWESLYSRSLTNNTPNQSERWMSSPAQLSLFLDVDSLGSCRDALKKFVLDLLTNKGSKTELKLGFRKPAVIMIVGVNGGGKTTSLDELSDKYMPGN